MSESKEEGVKCPESAKPKDDSSMSSDLEDIDKKRMRLLSTIPNSWRIRECRDYDFEHMNCRKLRNKLQAYYLGTEPEDCTLWKDNFDDCMKFVNSADEAAAERLVAREGERLKERLRGHFENDVWEKRTSPPDNWNAPLPDYLEARAQSPGNYLREYKIQQEFQSTQGALDLQSRKMTGYIAQLPLCTIM